MNFFSPLSSFSLSTASMQRFRYYKTRFLPRASNNQCVQVCKVWFQLISRFFSELLFATRLQIESKPSSPRCSFGIRSTYSQFSTFTSVLINGAIELSLTLQPTKASCINGFQVPFLIRSFLNTSSVSGPNSLFFPYVIFCKLLSVR